MHSQHLAGKSEENYLIDQGIKNNVIKVRGSRMKASVGVFNMAKGRAATMAAIWVQFPVGATEIFSPKVHIDRGADLSPLLNGQRGDANPARKAAGQ